jgi:hypothetical protein
MRYLPDTATPSSMFGLVCAQTTLTNARRNILNTATLHITITKRGEPCQISTIKQHFVYVLNCDGTPLVWCDKTYVGIPTRCGQLELEIPPGCYVVGAVEYTAGIRPFGNYLTHVAIVRANCGDELCLTLFDPSLHFCGTWIGAATNTYLAGGGQDVPRDIAARMKAVGEAANALVRALPQDDFVVAQAKAIGTAPPAGPKSRSKKSSK